jgi:hypothetical protein
VINRPPCIVVAEAAWLIPPGERFAFDEAEMKRPSPVE